MPVGRPTNVLLVTLDTTRPDHLGCYGGRAKTPQLDRLCAEGVRFDAAFTPIPSTFPSHAALMTGRYPQSVGVHDNAVYFMPAEPATLAETLRERGYATGAFVSAFVLDKQFRLDQGFEVYDDRVDRPLMANDLSKIPAGMDPARKKWEATIATAYQRRGDATVKAAGEWLGGLGARPFFLWVHLFDAHQPYQPPPPHERDYDPDYRGAMDGDQRPFFAARRKGTLQPGDFDHMVALYDGELSWLDDCVGQLLDAVSGVGRMDETLVVVVGDHGEGLEEHHQVFEHNSELYDEAVHVPLIVRRPGAAAHGEKVAALVRTIDLAPTISEWLGLPADGGAQGRSLLGFTEADAAKRAAAESPDDGDGAGSGEILLEALRARQINPVAESLIGLRDKKWKVIVALGADDEPKRVELYDLEADPGEKHDLSRERAEIAMKLRDKALGLYRQLPKPAGDNARELNAIDNDAVKQLGYGRR